MLKFGQKVLNLFKIMIILTYFGFRVQNFIIYLYKILEGAPHFSTIFIDYTLYSYTLLSITYSYTSSLRALIHFAKNKNIYTYIGYIQCILIEKWPPPSILFYKYIIKS